MTIAFSPRSQLVLLTVALIVEMTPLHGQSLSGNLASDVDWHHCAHPSWDAGDAHAGECKSILLATGLSAALPGAGQVYVGTPWWRPAIYGAIEVAAWIGFGVWTGAGNGATTDFEAFADRHWDVTRYISWIQQNLNRWSDAEIDRASAEQALSEVIVSTDPALDPWDRVNFDALNRLEKAVKGGFSHTLPRHGDQQYYEEIGKYIQYRSGWDDHAGSLDSLIFDPSFVTPRNQDYASQREHANDLLSYADYAIAAIVLNHLVSMLDAGISARYVNIRTSPRINRDRYGLQRAGFVVRVEYSFH